MLLFEQLYKELLELYTENINDVPRKVLGMSTSVQELPTQEPYGFWVDKSGNFLVVPRMGHINGLEHIVRKGKDYLAKQGIDYNPTYRYSDLFNLGWARVVFSPRDVYYELGPKQVLTSSQTKFLNFLKDLYDKEKVLQDV